jgi:hypothetical protein
MGGNQLMGRMAQLLKRRPAGCTSQLITSWLGLSPAFGLFLVSYFILHVFVFFFIYINY